MNLQDPMVAVSKLRCPRCGRRFRRADLRFYARPDNSLILDLRCPRCHGERSTVSATTAAQHKLSEQEEQRAVASPITYADVAEMRDFLASYHGDLAQLIRRGKNAPLH